MFDHAFTWADEHGGEAEWKVRYRNLSIGDLLEVEEEMRKDRASRLELLEAELAILTRIVDSVEQNGHRVDVAHLPAHRFGEVYGAQPSFRR